MHTSFHFPFILIFLISFVDDKKIKEKMTRICLDDGINLFISVVTATFGI